MAETSPFGARVEALLKQRRQSKAWLQQQLGVSRSTLWRLLNGQSRITLEERDAIARLLAVPISALEEDGEQWEPAPDHTVEPSREGVELEEYVSNLDRILRTLRTMPGGATGQRVKVGFLNGVEDAARETGNTLPAEFWRIRRDVHEGKL